MGKLATLILLACAILASAACGTGVLPAAPQSGIVGKWRNSDGSYNVEFSSNGSCSARMRIDGRDVGGPCTYTFDSNAIHLHYTGITGSAASVDWQYTLSGDTLTVSVFATGMALHRVG